MIPLIFVAIAAFIISGCTAVGTAAGAAADVAVSVISTTAEVTGDVIGGAASTVGGSSKGDRDSR
jgi:hypothetical protein